jgi:hypothetical protein
MHRVARAQRKLREELLGVAEDLLSQTDLQHPLVVSIYSAAQACGLRLRQFARANLSRNRRHDFRTDQYR